ncbi:MAG: hypothetical protein ACKOHG_06950, partial [Planctomycetia bacterium]
LSGLRVDQWQVLARALVIVSQAANSLLERGCLAGTLNREASQRERPVSLGDDVFEGRYLLLVAGLVDENPRARNLVQSTAGPKLNVMGAGAVFFPLVFEPASFWTRFRARGFSLTRPGAKKSWPPSKRSSLRPAGRSRWLASRLKVLARRPPS